MPEMSLSEAARWAGVTRATIHKALKSGRLSGRRDATSGEWRIEPSELERVYQPGRQDDGVESSTDTAELMAAKDRELVLLREMLTEVRAQRDDAIGQRDRAMALAEAQTRLLTHEREKAVEAPGPTPGGAASRGLPLLGRWLRRPEG